VTVRAGPKVDRITLQSLDAALDVLEARCRAVADGPLLEPVSVPTRTFTPVQRVAARVEVSGPGRLLGPVRGGVDVRGDGTTEAYLGRLRRRPVAPRPSETSYEALRRELGDASSTSAGP
jgi:hypothetical protein